MIVSLIKNGEITNFTLPAKIGGNFWITDLTDDNNVRNLISVEANADKWTIKSNFETKIVSSEVEYEAAILQDYSFYYLKVAGEKNYIVLYTAPANDSTFKRYAVAGDNQLLIGKDDTNQIAYKSEFVANQHAVINYSGGNWLLKNLDTNFGTFVNLKLVPSETHLYPGDIVFVMGLKIIVMNDFLMINNPNARVTINTPALTDKVITKPEVTATSEELENNIELYKEEDFFLRAPRFRTSIEKTKIVIDQVPAKENQQPMPIIYTIGPMMTMGLTSMVTGIATLTQVMSEKITWGQAAPSLIIAGGMLMTMMLWPLLSKGYEKRQRIRKERIRQNKYRKYLELKKAAIATAIKIQQQILTENNVSLDECKNVILSKKRNLWEREKEQDDFLKFRLGSGTVTPEIDIEYPEEHFTVDDDDLMDLVQSLVGESKDMPNVPISMTLTEKIVSAVVGDKTLTKQFIDSLILQLITFHSYEDLKIVFLTSKANENEWDYLKTLPHCWNDARNMRFFATNADEMKQISVYLESEYNNRTYHEEDRAESGLDYKNFSPYYVIVTDNLKVARNLGIFNSVLGQKLNVGFSVLIRNENLSNLPNECSTFINIGGEGGKTSGFFENELVSNKQKSFAAELNTNIDMHEVSSKLFNIPIKLAKGKSELPKNISFLEMYNVGKVEQLNPVNRWKTNNPILSLQAPVGVDESGELFKLDLHEKFHGPHGLIAGMTGSGKSEFIITYILSLATNYHPDELSFVLIDYKGGGLAGAFENKETGVKLPHLAGSITNLDTVEMKRSLASIQSELRRRQAMFNRAREILSESTVDIYKYQRLYREGLVQEPMSHLFIISDEFAELKVQQPEFMEQLISTARIGRSLGVHLILATQKPSGVVDDQIWSNSKFRVCLKVQDKSDSMDMIKSADAANLKDVGRFYLQVGYNEFFAMGQSAWCGAQYIPMEKRKRKRDNTINIIDNIGYVIKSTDTNEKIISGESQGEELPNIVKYLSDLAKNESIEIDQLWLDRIPDNIYVGDLKNKYAHVSEPFVINPIIGEYDDPANQRQGLLTLPLSTEGNTLIYGTAGSGEEFLLNTIIYSTIMDHTPEEINFYILDFGSETLRAFQDAPHVGDVLVSGDAEKIGNLFKMLTSIIAERKQLFASYNGDYNSYCKHSGKTVPAIVVMINNYEGFSELYEEYEDLVVQLTREGQKYGIVFVFTVNGSNGVRYRLLQNFKTQLVLQMNDQNDYSSILGSVNNTYPSKVVGRGLVKLEEVYEFQTAYPYIKDKLIEYVKIISNKLKDKVTTFAKPIPVLPEMISLDVVKASISGLEQVPIGVLKEELMLELFDFKSKYTTLITSQEIACMETFIPALTQVLMKVPNLNLIVIDAEDIFGQRIPAGCKYYNSGFDTVFNQLDTYLSQQEELYKSNNYNLAALNNYGQMMCIIVGINKFKTRLNEDNQALFDSFIQKGKELTKNNFIIVEMIDKLKDLEYDEWFKNVIVNNQGIWLGNGIGEQFTLKLAKTPRSLSDEIPNNFGYSVIRGNARLIKLLEYIPEVSEVKPNE